MNIWEASEYFSEFFTQFITFIRTYLFEIFFSVSREGLLSYWPFFTMAMAFIVFFTLKKVIQILNGI